MTRSPISKSNKFVANSSSRAFDLHSLPTLKDFWRALHQCQTLTSHLLYGCSSYQRVIIDKCNLAILLSYVNYMEKFIIHMVYYKNIKISCGICYDQYYEYYVGGVC